MIGTDEERPQPVRCIWLLGGTRVEHVGSALPVTGPKLQALLALLALNPGRPFTRAALADCLWPDAAPERVRPTLSDLLYRLRQALGPGWFTSEAGLVTLRAGPELWVDVEQFERLAAQDDPEAAQAAAALYRGELLPELFDDWLVVRRAALHERLVAGLLRVGASAEASDALDRALTAYQRAAQADPLDEDAVRGLHHTARAPPAGRAGLSLSGGQGQRHYLARPRHPRSRRDAAAGDAGGIVGHRLRYPGRRARPVAEQRRR